MKLTNAQRKFLLSLSESPKIPRGPEWNTSRILTRNGLIESCGYGSGYYHRKITDLAFNFLSMALCATLLVLAWLAACWTFAQAVALMKWITL